MRHLAGIIAALALALTGCSDTSDPLPAGSDEFPTTSATEPADVAAPPSTEAPKQPTTCDVVREALLTGTQAEIDASMRALVADKTADVDARETADDYLRRDNPESKESAASLLRAQCG